MSIQKNGGEQGYLLDAYFSRPEVVLGWKEGPEWWNNTPLFQAQLAGEKLTELSIKRKDKKKIKKNHRWHWEFVLGWKVKSLNSKNVSLAYWSNTDIWMYSVYSNLYKYWYLFPQKVKSWIKRLLDINKNPNQIWTAEPMVSNAPSSTCSVCLTWIHSPRVQLSTKSHTPCLHGVSGNNIKQFVKIQVKTDFSFIKFSFSLFLKAHSLKELLTYLSFLLAVECCRTTPGDRLFKGEEQRNVSKCKEHGWN